MFNSTRRLAVNQSLINGLQYPPKCVTSAANIPYVCHCDVVAERAGVSNSFVNCTPPSTVQPFTSSGAHGCLSSTGRRKRSTDASTQDDYIISLDTIPVNPFPEPTTTPVLPTNSPAGSGRWSATGKKDLNWHVVGKPEAVNPLAWPTASGITSSQADRTCRGRLQGLAVYAQCVNFVDLDKIVMDCVLDIAVS